MGSKSAAKALMEKAGVPLTPGYHGDRQEPDYLLSEARRIGFPVLIKAVAGGGGKGMRRVDAAEDFAAALASCQREATGEFRRRARAGREIPDAPPGTSRCRCSATTTATRVYLFERDCSVQRRHQKVLEEAPAPGMTPERRRQMGEAAVAAARAVNYAGAGTVEFIAAPDGAFYFMEMNTRLQVEHPVTEMITGLDLVEWQLRVAAGEPLPLKQEQLAIRGHAIEARIYAEDPARDFLPSIGRLEHLVTPRTGAEVRIDTGVRQGDEITPLLRPDDRQAHRARRDARGRDRRGMRDALAEYQVVGVQTNVEFLGRLMTAPSFVSANLDTALIERERAHLFPARRAASRECWSWRRAHWRRRSARRSPRVRPGRAATAGGWSGRARRTLEIARRRRRCGTSKSASRTSRCAGRRRECPSARQRDPRIRFRRAPRARVDRPLSSRAGSTPIRTVACVAPMPGRILAVMVGAGDAVKRGAPLVVMEAMKMEHTVVAPADGIVDRDPVRGGRAGEGRDRAATVADGFSADLALGTQPLQAAGCSG